MTSRFWLPALVGFVSFGSDTEFAWSHSSAYPVVASAYEAVVSKAIIAKNIFIPNLADCENRSFPAFQHSVKFRLPFLESIFVRQGAVVGQSDLLWGGIFIKDDFVRHGNQGNSKSCAPREVICGRLSGILYND